MENATKALIMAATILISVVIISLGIYLAVTFSSYSSQVDKDVRTNQISQFNSQFLKYQGQDVTIYDIVTVANLAKENNNNYELTVSDANEGTLYISIEVKGLDGGSNTNYHFENDASTFMKTKMSEQIDESTGELRKYKCTGVNVSEYTQRVYKLTFEKL